ncbi:hemerythrin domain-containing protein [Porphyromonas loveana]|uniref:Regulator of cell morphogenesis and NO signaling n=1 Tax=Porphyromonas loveana TaxID=1884669 RepID=A0A2U1FKQ4_9PORP|nr:hemerythrin domain-containing protein [Porphyromonas loveana]PVZ12758.1 regulator of cell morphogenesis and NO signaling [Porphyromonas loveana]
MTSHPIHNHYSSNTKLSDLICENYDLLLVITRFGISLGFGDKSIREVCEENNVNTNTLMAVINTLINRHERPSDALLATLSAPSLISYLRQSHDYFLQFRLPALRQKLLSALSECPSEVVFVIRQFYDEYAEEVHKHMSYEEKTVFPYVERLLAGKLDGRSNYRIDIFSKRHDQIEMKITELKNLLIKYYPVRSGYELNSVLHDIFSAEDDLSAHNFVEDYLFVPLIRRIEKENGL